MVHSIKLRITETNGVDVYDLLESEKVPYGTTKEFGEDATLRYDGTLVANTPETDAIIHLILEVGSSVAIGVVSSWLYDKLKNDEEVTLQIEGQDVDIKEDEIKTHLEEVYEE